MARKKHEFETWLARFPVGTKARIDAAISSRTALTRAGFVREAVHQALLEYELYNKPEGAGPPQRGS